MRTIKDRLMEAERGKQEMSLRGMLTTIESDTALEMDLDSMLMKENSTKMMDCEMDNMNVPQQLEIHRQEFDILLNASVGRQEQIRMENNVNSGGGMLLSANIIVNFEQPQDFNRRNNDATITGWHHEGIELNNLAQDFSVLVDVCEGGQNGSESNLTSSDP